MSRIAWCSGLLAWRLAASSHAADGQPSVAALRPFLETHCFECHDADSHKGDLRLDALEHDLGVEATLERWQSVRDHLHADTMPPPKEPRPTATARQAALESLDAALLTEYQRHAQTPAQPVIRRLNRMEFRNTLRDLLDLRQPLFRQLGVPKPEDSQGDGSVSSHSQDPVREFPADEQDHGLDTLGDRLVMSDFRLKLVLQATEECMRLATVNEERPRREVLRFVPPIRTEGPGEGVEAWSRVFNPAYDALMARYLEPGAASSAGRVAPSRIAATGVGASGRYRITAQVSAHNRHHPWGALVETRTNEAFRLGLHLIDSRRGAFNEGNPDTQTLAEWDVPDDGNPHTYAVECWIDSTWLPWLGWENGPHERSVSVDRLAKALWPTSHRPPPPGNAPEPEKLAYRRAQAHMLFAGGYAGPHLRIHGLEIEPLEDEWPPAGHRRLYGETGREPVAEVILAFARRAWRAPVAPEEVAAHIALAESRLAAGATRGEALRTAHTAIIASPRCQYLRDVEGAADFNLAWRLSYFLWSSMPDEELCQLAAAGRLSDDRVRRAQVDRMLNHPNAAFFVRRFTAVWLRLDKLGSMPPPGGFYFHRQMEEQMLRQTDAFFADLLARNAPLREVVESDHTFLNERTAHWIYKRADVPGDGFRRVPALPPHGGGMLTMPAVMTATANGVDTSPIVRGVWVLENLLGTPPRPPPSNVEPLSPDLRGARTLREQLEAHRAQASCRSCHEKMDPYGFAFENFDELGLWRTHFRTGDKNLPVDPVSELPDGRKITGIADMKQVFLAKEELIARHLIRTMLSYACGRRMGPFDRGEVDRLAGTLAATRYPLRDVVHAVASSPIFLGSRPVAPP